MILSTPLLAALMAPGAALAADDIAAALRQVSAPTAALAMVDGYPGGTVSAGFRQQLSTWTRTRLAASAQRHLDAARVQCETTAKVSFLEAGTFGATEEERTFEESVFMVESVYCLDSGTAADAARHYSSTAFRVGVMPFVNSFSLSGNQMCLSTEAKAGLLKATNFCHEIVRFQGPEMWGSAGWLVSNDPDPSLQPLFFRETVVVFVDKPDGGVAGFRGVVTRSRDLGALQRAVLRTTVSGGHTRIESGLRDHVNGTD